MPGADTVFFPEGTIKGGVIGKTNLMAYFFQIVAPLYQGFCGNKPPLGDTMVKADAHPFPECLGNGALADPEAPGCILQGDALRQMGFDVSQHPIQQIGAFCVGTGALTQQHPLQQRQNDHSIADDSAFPAGSTVFRLLAACPQIEKEKS